MSFTRRKTSGSLDAEHGSGEIRHLQCNPEYQGRNSGETTMRRSLHRFALLALLPVLILNCAAQGRPQAQAATAVIWADPGDIRSKDLFWGLGGNQDQPKPPFEFLEEDHHGTNPKFDVRDSDGKKWHVKLGAEARPEVAASRLLWAIGYSANENYFLAQLHVNDLPPLTRGQGFVRPGGDILGVRLQRPPHGKKRIGNWNWRHNPFVGTREFNGLRVMMALIRNWDLKDDNNAILQADSDRTIYEVTDVGAAFGSSGKRHSSAYSKGNLKEFRKGQLISKTHDDFVDLHFPTLPWPILALFEARFYFSQVGTRWIGKDIPREHAKWVGSLLAQLSPDQIRDAFRAAGFSPDQVEGYTTVLISRIQELNGL
jgi:hypothetical protein